MDERMIARLMRPGEFLTAKEIAARMIEAGEMNPTLVRQAAKMVSITMASLHASGKIERRRKKNVWSYGTMRALAGQRRARWTDVLGVFDGAP